MLPFLQVNVEKFLKETSLFVIYFLQVCVKNYLSIYLADLRQQDSNSQS